MGMCIHNFSQVYLNNLKHTEKNARFLFSVFLIKHYHSLIHMCICLLGFPGGLVVQNLPVNEGDVSSFPGLGKPPAEGNGNPL